MIILFLGTPAAGKGTQAKLLQATLGLPLIVTGDLLRAATSKSDKLGEQIRSHIEQGHLVPDDLVIKLIMKEFEDPICREKGFMLDGFPRTLEQAVIFVKFMAKHNYKIDKMLYYNLDEETAIDRIVGRRICSQCGFVFHITNMPPKQKNICDYCQSPLVQRPDDTEKVMKKRFEAYHAQTYPLVKYYKDKGVLLEIDANNTIQKIFTNTLKQLNLSEGKNG